MAKAFKEAEVEKKAGRKPILARIDFDDERLKCCTNRLMAEVPLSPDSTYPTAL
jgi:hypothetical protein